MSPLLRTARQEFLPNHLLLYGQPQTQCLVPSTLPKSCITLRNTGGEQTDTKPGETFSRLSQETHTSNNYCQV